MAGIVFHTINKARGDLMVTLPPSFPMELEDSKLKRFFAQEAKHRPYDGRSESFKILWQPHNYRLYFDYQKPSDRTSIGNEGTVGVRYKNHDSEAELTIGNCKVTLKKNQAEVINLKLEKDWIMFERPNIGEIEAKIEEIRGELREESRQALETALELLGGKTEYKILRERCENGIHGIDWLDKIPKDRVIHDTVFKKVYSDKTEVYGMANTKNLIKNACISNVSEEIADELINLRQAVNPLLFLKQTINRFEDIFNLKAEIGRLSQEDKDELGKYLFEVFGYG